MTEKVQDPKADESKKPDPEIRTAMNETQPAPAPPAPTVVKRIFSESMSPTVGKIAAALAKAQGAMTNGPKDKDGYGYKYLQLPSLIDIVRKPLTDNGIALVQSHELITGKHPTTVTHSLMIHSSGEWLKNSLEVMIHIMPQLSTAQMQGVAATYGRRYALQAMCMVAAEDDNDATSKQG